MGRFSSDPFFCIKPMTSETEGKMKLQHPLFILIPNKKDNLTENQQTKKIMKKRSYFSFNN